MHYECTIRHEPVNAPRESFNGASIGSVLPTYSNFFAYFFEQRGFAGSVWRVETMTGLEMNFQRIGLIPGPTRQTYQMLTSFG